MLFRSPEFVTVENTLTSFTLTRNVEPGSSAGAASGGRGTVLEADGVLALGGRGTFVCGSAATESAAMRQRIPPNCLMYQCFARRSATIREVDDIRLI